MTGPGTTRGGVTFVTPYWEGAEMMRVHLHSIRRFHPEAPILISKRGGDAPQMEAFVAEFGITYWLEELSYENALLALLGRCETEFVCITDHDTVLLAPVDQFLSDLAADRYDLVGIEELILREPGGPWMRRAPGYMDATFLVFNWRAFNARWGLEGVGSDDRPGSVHDEYHYGLCDRLPRHEYLRPYHTRRYGLGNLVLRGEAPILFHLWFGAHRKRSADGTAAASGLATTLDAVEAGERAVLADYPDLDLSHLVPAWTRPRSWRGFLATLRRVLGYGPLGMLRALREKLDPPSSQDWPTPGPGGRLPDDGRD